MGRVEWDRNITHTKLRFAKVRQRESKQSNEEIAK